jgi:GNAT superfamily N-acetyltransferase
VALAARVHRTDKTLSEGSREISCRPARSSDTLAVQEFLRSIWDGEDYVPGVWEEWLTSKTGLLVVAEFNQRTAGLGRLRDLGWGEWWLEGLRVAPQLQGHGIASHIHEYLLDRWLETDGIVLRLGTHARRQAVRHLCERTGFQHIARLGDLHAHAREGEHSFHRADRLQLPEAESSREGIKASPFCNRLMNLDWAWACLRRERIGEGSRNSFWSWRGLEGWVILHQPAQDIREDILLQAYDAPDRYAPEFFSEIRALTHQLGKPGVRLFTQMDLAQNAFWIEAGWELDPEEDLLIFERRR